jgi:hypothetical protein
LGRRVLSIRQRLSAVSLSHGASVTLPPPPPPLWAGALNVGRADGTTPLYAAAYHGQIEACRWLVLRGARVGE